MPRGLTASEIVLNGLADACLVQRFSQDTIITGGSIPSGHLVNKAFQ